MRILLKCPTRNRRERFLATLQTWVDLAEQPELLGIVVNCDTDDSSMADFTEDHLPTSVAYRKVFRDPNRTKIQACNARMGDIDWNWDIVILMSDDMVPQVKGYDTQIRNAMHPGLDHIVWIYDGVQGPNLNTLNIFGRRRYEAWGYLYHPDYKSFYCDNEVTDWCRKHPSQCTVIPQVLVKHVHFITGEVPMDALYRRNQSYVAEDERTYQRRRASQSFGFLKLLSRR